ncbi:MAG: ATPase, T2SS/T4P/T4SS family [Clostridium fessum]
MEYPLSKARHRCRSMASGADLRIGSALQFLASRDPDIASRRRDPRRSRRQRDRMMRAAMTGHLVITTIHTEDAISAIDRLRDMGAQKRHT